MTDPTADGERTSAAETTTTGTSMVEAPRARPAPMLAGAEVGALVPRTLEEAYRLADAMSRSGLTPASIKTPEAVLVAILAGSEVGLKPFQSLQSIAVINGRPSLWGDAIPALLWASGFKLREWFENAAEDYPNNMTAMCEITRPDGQTIVGEFSVADAKEAGLWGKAGPWQTSKKRMMKMRARSFGARDGAPDVLRGLYVAEESEDIVVVTPDAQIGGTGMAQRQEERRRTAPAEVDPAGFNARTVAAETAAAKPAGRSKKAAEPKPEEAPAAAEPPPPAEATHPAAEPPAEPASAAAPQAEGGVQDAEFTDGAPTPREEAVQALAGCAPPDEAYLMAGEAPGIDGKWTLYQNGVAFSRVGTKGYENFPQYKDHAALKAPAASAEPTRPQPGEEYRLDADEEVQGRHQIYCDGAPIKMVNDPSSFQVYDAHPLKVAEPAQSPAATAAAAIEDDDLPAALRGAPAAPEPAADEADDLTRAYVPPAGDPPPAIRETPEDRRDPEQGAAATLEPRPGSLQAELRPMTSWLQIKQRVVQLYKESDFQALEVVDQNAIRRMVWAEVVRVKRDHRDPVDFCQDPSAFRLWMEAQQGADAAAFVTSSFEVLKGTKVFTEKLTEEQRSGFTATVEARIASLSGRQ